MSNSGSNDDDPKLSRRIYSTFGSVLINKLHNINGIAIGQFETEGEFWYEIISPEAKKDSLTKIEADIHYALADLFLKIYHETLINAEDIFYNIIMKINSSIDNLHNNYSTIINNPSIIPFLIDIVNDNEKRLISALLSIIAVDTHIYEKYGIATNIKNALSSVFERLKELRFFSTIDAKTEESDVHQLITDIDIELQKSALLLLEKYLSLRGVNKTHLGALTLEVAREIEFYIQRNISATKADEENESLLEIAQKWNNEVAKEYKGRVFDWVKDNFKNFIPGLTTGDLRGNKALYNTVMKNIERNGLPDWLKARRDETADEARAALARRRSTDRVNQQTRRRRTKGPSP